MLAGPVSWILLGVRMTSRYRAFTNKISPDDPVGRAGILEFFHAGHFVPEGNKRPVMDLS